LLSLARFPLTPRAIVKGTRRVSRDVTKCANRSRLSLGDSLSVRDVLRALPATQLTEDRFRLSSDAACSTLFVVPTPPASTHAQNSADLIGRYSLMAAFQNGKSKGLLSCIILLPRPKISLSSLHTRRSVSAGSSATSQLPSSFDFSIPRCPIYTHVFSSTCRSGKRPFLRGVT
jgi:hypothetical protein